MAWRQGGLPGPCSLPAAGADPLPMAKNTTTAPKSGRSGSKVEADPERPGGKGSSGSGTRRQGDGGGWPSTTGNRSGSGRSNATRRR